MSERPTTPAHTAKHAKAKNVHIRIKRMNRDIEITVAGHGQGFDPVILESVAIKEEFGLASIRECLRRIGGQFQLQSSQGKGAKIILTAPLNRVEKSNQEMEI